MGCPVCGRRHHPGTTLGFTRMNRACSQTRKGQEILRAASTLPTTEPEARSEEDPMEALICMSEIADICGASRSTVSNWRKRWGNFPEPVYEYGQVQIFARTRVLAWLTAHHVPFVLD